MTYNDSISSARPEIMNTYVHRRKNNAKQKTNLWLLARIYILKFNQYFASILFK